MMTKGILTSDDNRRQQDDGYKREYPGGFDFPRDVLQGIGRRRDVRQYALLLDVCL